MEQALIRLDNLSKYYTSGQNVVVGLYGLDLQFHRGEFIAITGESGSGKSTLSHVLGGILPYESGELYLNGQPTSHYDSVDWERYRRDNVSFISQSYGILPGATVLSNVVTALRLSGMEKHSAKHAAEGILRQVDLWELRHRRAAKLSSGQKQRLSIARALAKPSSILIADEPTGNLDPENSKIVIDLLAQAAKDRLVILVTHEFSEAGAVATRHIILQDGRVIMDAPLRDANTPGAIPTPGKKSKAPISPFVARLQQSSRPIWSTLMTLFFAITAFAVFVFLGAFIIALDDTNTRIYDAKAFANGDPLRIVVTTLDKRPLTQEDYDLILRKDYVTSLETNGYLTDVQYAYRNGKDYKTINTESVDPNTGAHYMEVSYQPYFTAPFMKTVPILSEGQFPLLEGQLPASFYEVVAHTDDGLEIGERVMVFILNDKYWGLFQYMQLEFTVVGITDYGDGLYFHNDVGRFCQQVSHTNNGNGFPIMIPEDLQATESKFQQIINNYPFDVEVPEGFSPYLADDQFRVHPNRYTQMFNPFTEEMIPYDLPNINKEEPYAPENTLRLTFPETFSISVPKPDGTMHTGEYSNYLLDVGITRVIQVSQNTFDTFTWNQSSEQVSISIADYAYTDRVLEALHKEGYVATSPYQQGSTRIDEEKAAQREQTLTVCLAALAAIIALQIVLLRALFSVQTDSYKLMSHIGLVSSSAALSVLWQILGFTLLGQLLGSAGIWLCGKSGIQRIAEIIRYLPPKYIAILSVVHLTVSLIATMWVISSVKKQVYPLAGKYSDINLDSYEQEAAV